MPGKSCFTGKETARAPGSKTSPAPSLISAVRETFWRWWLCAAVVAAIIYGSLIPFRFDTTRFSTERFFGETLAFRATSAEDVAVNAALYAALSCVLYGVRVGRTRRAVAVVALCAVLSIALEALQMAIPQRVSSGTDVLFDVLGAGCGVVVIRFWAARRLAVLQTAARNWRLRPLGLIASVVSCGVLAYDLLPFDFVTGTSQLHAAFQRIHPMEFPASPPAISAELSHVFVFMLLGFLVAVDSLRSGISRLEAMVLGVRNGLVLSCLIEALQLFTNSHVAELSCILMRTAASLLGAWAAIFLVHPPLDLERILQGGPALRIFLYAAAILQFFTIGLDLSVGHHVPRAGAGWVLPFYGLWLLPAPLAAAKTLSCIVTVAILFVTLAALLRQMTIPRSGMLACGMISAFYFACEAFRVGLTRTPLDVTNVILALLTCLWVMRQADRLRLPLVVTD